MEKSEDRIKGLVKWFNAGKGYGFIERDGGEDVFVHHSAILMEGYRQLEQCDHVEFEVLKTAKGPMAANVVVMAKVP